jgi:hypothetical protein
VTVRPPRRCFKALSWTLGGWLRSSTRDGDTLCAGVAPFGANSALAWVGLGGRAFQLMEIMRFPYRFNLTTMDDAGGQALCLARAVRRGRSPKNHAALWAAEWIGDPVCGTFGTTRSQTHGQDKPIVRPRPLDLVNLTT